MTFCSTHKLKFEILDHNFQYQFSFRIGTTSGLYEVFRNRFVVTYLKNETPRNGHATDVLEWFAYRCKKRNKDLEFNQVFTDYYRKHLLEKHGFEVVKGATLMKRFRIEKKWVWNDL